MKLGYSISGTVAAVALAGVASPAMAQGAPGTMASYVASNWTGGYIGGQVGMVRGLFTDGSTCETYYDDTYSVFMIVEEPGDDLDPGGPCLWNLFVGSLQYYTAEGTDIDNYYQWQLDDEYTAAGYLAGAQIGYRLAFGQGPVGLVIGGEVSHAFSNLSQHQDAWVNFGTFFCFDGDNCDLAYGDTAVQGTLAMSQLTTATMQVGFAAGPALFYAKAGLALGQFSYSNTLGFNGTTTAAGLVYGGGVEVRVSDRVSIFGEYNRLKFRGIQMLGTQEITLFQDECCGIETVLSPTLITTNFDANVFKMGFNFGLGN